MTPGDLVVKIVGWTVVIATALALLGVAFGYAGFRGGVPRVGIVR